jgi:hypothetical protein
VGCCPGGSQCGCSITWEVTKTPTEGATPVAPATPTADAPSEAEARVLVVENDIDAWDEPLPSSNAKSASPDTEPATPERPPRVISLTNFEKALKEITPSSSESLGTLSELRKWNDEFGEGEHVWEGEFRVY